VELIHNISSSVIHPSQHAPSGLIESVKALENDSTEAQSYPPFMLRSYVIMSFLLLLSVAPGVQSC